MNKNILVYVFSALAIMWSVWAMWRFSGPRLELGLTEQQKIYSFEPTVYLDDKPLPSCSEDIETRVCRYSCAPDGLCIFVPREIMKQYKF